GHAAGRALTGLGGNRNDRTGSGQRERLLAAGKVGDQHEVGAVAGVVRHLVVDIDDVSVEDVQKDVVDRLRESDGQRICEAGTWKYSDIAGVTRRAVDH